MDFQTNAEQERIISEFYKTSPRWQDIARYRSIREEVGRVKNLFYGDSITSVWPLHEFFPNHSVLGRGIGSDNIYGLRLRLDEDVFPYKPERVFILVGINGIEWDSKLIADNLTALGEMVAAHGAKPFLSSVLPLRRTPNCDARIKFQGKIVEINKTLEENASKNGFGFLDYHASLRDESGEIAEDCVNPDGLHPNFNGYRRMSALVRSHLAD